MERGRGGSSPSFLSVSGTDFFLNYYNTDLCGRRLTGVTITNVVEAWQAMELLHAKGPHTVVLSSTELGSNDYLLGLASSYAGELTVFTCSLLHYAD